jgi:hypothetical protein
MKWELSDRCDEPTRKLADRHYNRQHIGAANFVPPGRCLVLVTPKRDAFWVTSWPYEQYVRHAWGGAWVCSAFRNEGETLSSELIREALAITRWRWPEIPEKGMVTFVNTEKVRKKRDWGRCYRKAGFKEVGKTKGGLVALQILKDEMPPPEPPLGTTGTLL